MNCVYVRRRRSTFLRIVLSLLAFILSIGSTMNAANTPEGTPRANRSPTTQWHEPSSNPPPHVYGYGNGFATDFINHSIAGGYSYADQQTQAVQAYAPFVAHNGGVPFDPWQQQQQQQQGAVFAGGHYGTPQPQLPVMEQLGFGGHHNSSGSIETIVVKLRPQSAPTTPLLRRVQSDFPLNQQQQQQQLQQQNPYTKYGKYVPLFVSVHQLHNDKRLKALIDAEKVLLNYNSNHCSNCNQVKGGYHLGTNQAPPPPSGEGDGYGRYQGPPPSPKKDLFIFHVPHDMTEGELCTIFSRIGKVNRTRIQVHSDESTAKGYGFVTFKRLSDAVVAVHSLNGFPIGDKNLAVNYCRDDSKRNNNRPASASTNPTTSVNNGIHKLPKEDGAGNRKARRGQRRPSA